ncbi:hypothetical protein GCM10010329_79620 [Streptomyces spiroverticillatus]|uniref:SD-repeat containing protein B domain-containing protein n=1 Tax=Streptomyces finlayi TaxID=67296 RepID=A0A918X9P0_9ACTN|nr:SpaA isopeptide-forming pilin-related protein [Streptomyces finlayi]GHA44961.1 hypothetical protein GCM10010329_79620 [Streptomyces spiroverticillatus]GHD18131.1 hypothetical protein GCM10010334_80600 [Streptomyces finlayi]
MAFRHRPGGLRASAAAFLAAHAVLAAGGLAPAAAVSAPGDGTVTVRVVRDVDSDGTWTPKLEVGEPGIPVDLTDDAGSTVTVNTGADGRAVFTPASSGLAGGRYRVEARIPADKPFLRPAQAGGPAPSLSSLVEFVDVRGGKDATVVTGVHDPHDYCHANPLLATPCMRQDGPGVVGSKALVSWPYDRAGEDPEPTDETTFDKIGATYGLAHQRSTDRLFVGALTKRLVPYGPAGSGGIYMVDRKSGTTSTFAVVPDAGATPHSTDLTRDSMALNNAVGKEGLGDLDLSGDGKKLYAVNLHTKSLHVYDVSNVTPGAPPATAAQVIPIPDPGCPSGPEDWRPYGLGYRDGAMFVGGTCSAESTQNRADLRAYVLKLNGTTFTTEVTHTLDYERGMGYASVQGDTHWQPWLKTWDPYAWYIQANFPGPMLSDIEFDRDGSLILGFRDRLGDQAGYDAPSPEGSSDTALRSLFPAMGDITRVCKTAAGYVWDSDSAACPSHFVNGSEPPQQDGVKEYYPGDSTLGQLAESLQGGLAFAPRFDKTVSTIVDPTNTFTGGVRKFDNVTGAGSDSYRVDGGVGSFGKANGLGDLELLCDPPPVQIGNRVWFDRDRNGIQDPTEEPLPGTTVTLLDGTGKVLKTTTTNDRGEYYFQVEPQTPYRITFDATTADTSGVKEQPPAEELKPTYPGRGTNTSVDSNPDRKTQTDTLTTGEPGDNDHTHDAGYFINPVGPLSVLKTDAESDEPLAGAVFQLWRETNGTPGLQVTGDAPDTTVGDPCTTTADGKCRQEKLPLGSYYWQETQAPPGHIIESSGVHGPLELTAENAEPDGVSVTVENMKPPQQTFGSVSVLKTDAASGKPLAGAVFQLWHETNGAPGLQTQGARPDSRMRVPCTTTSDGTCLQEHLSLGTYYWQETKAPPGYLLPTPGISRAMVLTATNAQQGVKVTMTNPRIPPPVRGRLTLTKTDSKTGKSLAGAVFQLWRETNKRPGLQTSGRPADTRVDSGCATDHRGRCAFTGLVPGAYYLRETAVPEGYLMPARPVSGPYTVTAANAAAGVWATVRNTPGEPPKK